MGRRSGRSVRYGTVVAGLVMAVAASGGCGKLDGYVPPVRQHVAIPAYWSPQFEPGPAMFRRLAQAAPAVRMVVVNGTHSAPEAPFNQSWSDAIAALDGAGIAALGYVNTGYLGTELTGAESAHATRSAGAGRGGSRPEDWFAQIRQDINDWFSLYGAAGLDGIFLDQTTALCGPQGTHVEAYTEIVAYVRSLSRTGYVALNPGRSVERCYAELADALVTFEGSYQQYLDRTAPSWERASAPDRFWHLVYDVPDERRMQHAVALSKERNAGYVYVTDDQLSVDGPEHPWDTIPSDSYWRAELTAVYGSDFG